MNSEAVDHFIFQMGTLGKGARELEEQRKKKKVPNLQLYRGALTDASHTG